MWCLLVIEAEGHGGGNGDEHGGDVACAAGLGGVEAIADCSAAATQLAMCRDGHVRLPLLCVVDVEDQRIKA